MLIVWGDSRRHSTESRDQARRKPKTVNLISEFWDFFKPILNWSALILADLQVDQALSPTRAMVSTLTLLAPASSRA